MKIARKAIGFLGNVRSCHLPVCLAGLQPRTVSAKVSADGGCMIDWMFAHQAWTAFLIFAAVLIIFAVNLIAAAHSIDDEDEDYEDVRFI